MKNYLHTSNKSSNFARANVKARYDSRINRSYELSPYATLSPQIKICGGPMNKIKN